MPFCKKCGKEILDDGFLGYCTLSCMGDLVPTTRPSKHKKSTKEFSSVSSLDYHGMRLFEAKNKLVDDVIEAYESGDDELQIVHGFKHGQAIKAYILRKNGLTKEVKALRSDINLRIISGSTKGNSIIQFVK